MLYLSECYRGGQGGRAGWFMKFRTGADGFADGIAALKRAVPWTDRSYDDETHEWWLAEEYAAETTRLIPGLEAHIHQPFIPGFAP